METLEIIEENQLLMEDILGICNLKFDFSKLRGKSILLTGATGLIGSHIIKSVVYLNHLYGYNIQLIATTRDVKKAKEILGTNPRLEIVEWDILSDFSIANKVDYIIHLASITDSKSFINKPIETVEVIMSGTKKMLELAHVKDVKKFIYVSSAEIYGVSGYGSDEIKEQDYGYIDFLQSRSSYPQAKRMAESLCMYYYFEKKVPVCIARLCQTFGMSVSAEDKRMFAQFVKAVLNDENIILHTRGDTVRSYCYLIDTITALFYLLSLGESGEAYNVSNENMTMSVKEIADFVAKSNGIEVDFEMKNNEVTGYLPTLHMKISSEKLRKLGWKPQTDMQEAFSRMIKNMKIMK